eukprot:jgi/Chrpa1/25027/Chrysochromulina_OHIO_Genome00007502-RA
MITWELCDSWSRAEHVAFEAIDTCIMLTCKPRLLLIFGGLRVLQDGQTALMYASANGHVEVIKFLLASGAKIEATDNFVFTALMIASTQGELDSIEVLLAAGANLDAKDKFGKTALDKARQCGHADAVKLLESGDSYYWNDATGESTWEAPLA